MSIYRLKKRKLKNYKGNKRLADTLSYWFAWQPKNKLSPNEETKEIQLEGPFTNMFEAKIKQFTFSLNETDLTAVFAAQDRNSATQHIVLKKFKHEH